MLQTRGSHWGCYMFFSHTKYKNEFTCQGPQQWRSRRQRWLAQGPSSWRSGGQCTRIPLNRIPTVTAVRGTVYEEPTEQNTNSYSGQGDSVRGPHWTEYQQLQRSGGQCTRTPLNRIPTVTEVRGTVYEDPTEQNTKSYRSQGDSVRGTHWTEYQQLQQSRWQCTRTPLNRTK